ncbi:hypothetical protein J6590_025425 [Homalodisca vitripennis]|nr:hypothetical protein J6590_025425 [Homalodisca vitripennis]
MTIGLQMLQQPVTQGEVTLQHTVLYCQRFANAETTSHTGRSHSTTYCTVLPEVCKHCNNQSHSAKSLYNILYCTARGFATQTMRKASRALGKSVITPRLYPCHINQPDRNLQRPTAPYPCNRQHASVSRNRRQLPMSPPCAASSCRADPHSVSLNTLYIPHARTSPPKDRFV